jgi:hypothetical protein
MRGLALAIFFVTAAQGQDLRRVFHLTDFTSPGGAQEIATALRTVLRIPQAGVDPANADLIVSGPEPQVALAEWLVPKLDVPPGANPEPQKCAIAGNRNDLLDVVELKNADAYAALQEMLNTLRAVADISQIYQISAPRILVFRGDVNQIALAEFLIGELDLPAQTRQTPLVHRFQIAGAGSDVVLIYGLVHMTSASRMQAIVTDLRTVLGIFKEYRSSAPKLLAIRANANTIQMVEWLIPKLDTLTPSPEGNEKPVPGSLDDFVDVFYLKHATGMVAMSRIYESVGAAPQMSKTYYFSLAPPAIIVRGSAKQIASARAIVEAGDQVPPSVH